MNTLINTNTILGIIEHRGRTIAAHVPLEVLTFDTLSYAIAREKYLISESINSDYTAEESAEFADRARFLEQWIDGGCTADVPLHIDLNLYLRTSHLPAIVTSENIDSYISAILSVSTTVPLESLDEPAFAIRNNDGAELWLTDARALRNARLYHGSGVCIVETTTADLKAIIASQKLPCESTCDAMTV